MFKTEIGRQVSITYDFWASFVCIKQVFVHDLDVNVRLQFSKKKLFCFWAIIKQSVVLCSYHHGWRIFLCYTMHIAVFPLKKSISGLNLKLRQQRIISCLALVEHLIHSPPTTFKKRRRFKAERSGSSYKNNPTPPHIQPQKTTNLEQKYFTTNMYTIGNLGLLQKFVNMQESCVKKFWFDGQKKKKRRID